MTSEALDGRSPLVVAEWLWHFLKSPGETECDIRMAVKEGDLSTLLVLHCPGTDDIALPPEHAASLVRLLVKRYSQRQDTHSLINALVHMIQRARSEERRMLQ